MALSNIIGQVFAGGTLTALARVVDTSVSPITQSGVSAISYTINLVNSDGSFSPVTDHTGVSLDPTVVVTDTLETDGLWSVDTTGYNFRHVVDISTNPAFALAGRTYLIVYTITPTVGQILLFRYQIACI